MRRAEDDVDRVRIVGEDRRKRVDDVLDALVRREEPEGENQRPPFHAEAAFAAGERHVRDPVRDHVDLLLGHTMNVAQKHRAAGGHDHEPVGELRDLVHDAPLVQIRRGQDRVQRRHDRHAQLAKH